MYKLVVVAGKLRGQEFTLQDGENILGRDSGCDIHFPVQGVSKKHMSVTVTDDSCYIQDLGSSNGTFLNGKLIKRATAKNGDKIALPDSILQVVYVEEKKIIIKKKSTQEDEDDEDAFITGGTPPDALPQKILWLFKYKLMPFIHGINEEYEWRVLFGILLFIFIVLSVTATIAPVLRDSKYLLLNEVAERGAHYADEIVRMNNRALQNKQLDKINTGFLNNEKSVTEYRLYDLDGRIVRPQDLMNEYISKPFYVQVKNYYEKNKYADKVYMNKLSDGIIGIGKLIQAYNPRTGRNEPVGMIAIKFSPTSLRVEGAMSQKAYVESLVTTIIVAIIFYLMVYFLTLRPMDEMKFQIEEAIAGKRKSLESKWLMLELDPLRNSVNTLLQRMRELSNEGDEEFAEEESDEQYVQRLSEFMKGAGVPVILLDSQKNVAKINLMAEDLTGIRESSSEGMSLLDVSREKGFAATVIELCDNAANDNGNNQEGSYELGGYDHTIHVNALIGSDNFAKAYYITFVKEE